MFMVMAQTRVAFADYLRVFACFLVILIHVCGEFLATDFAGKVIFDSELILFCVTFYDGVLGRMSVPLFIIISAYFLIPVKDGMSMIDFYKRRFLRVLPPFIIFQIIYSVVPNINRNGVDLNRIMHDFVYIVFNFNEHAYHLWFMYILLSIYLFIPIISPWIDKAKPQEELVFIGLFFISTFIPWIHRFVTDNVWGECDWNKFHVLFYFSGFLGYVVLAHYIRCHIQWSNKKRIFIGLLLFMSGAIFTGCTIWKTIPVGVFVETSMFDWTMEYCSPNVFCETFGIFLIFSCINNHRLVKTVTELSKLSFGVYLIHILLLQRVMSCFFLFNINTIVSEVFAIPIIAIVTFMLCSVICKMLSYLPGMRWFLGI